MSSEDLNMQQTVSQSANQEKQKQSSSAHAIIANANATTTTTTTAAQSSASPAHAFHAVFRFAFSNALDDMCELALQNSSSTSANSNPNICGQAKENGFVAKDSRKDERESFEKRARRLWRKWRFFDFVYGEHTKCEGTRDVWTDCSFVRLFS